MRESAFNIYNASAGSGKTFTLVKEYLKIILASEKNRGFHQILAVTFTNKAVNEMKQRILDSLAEMSVFKDPEETSDMENSLAAELGLERKTLQRRSKDLLQKILHNYAFFDVSTIDKFTHRVIRSFAKDLKISQKFEVILDTDRLLDEAIDNLLAKSGENQELTSAIIAFAIEKADADKHWDVKSDLLKVGKMLFRENDLPHIGKLVKKKVSDFKAVQQQLGKEIGAIDSQVSSLAINALKFIDEAGLSAEDFPRQTLPKHFKRIRSGEFNPDKLYKNSIEKQLREGKILKSNVPSPAIDLCSPLLKKFLEIKAALYKRAFLINIYQNLIPLTILNSIYLEVKTIEEQKDLLPISSFNTLISNTIANQPAPFIYERLGEKYRHYFIDEFQDTSQMQWRNLVPLVSNALESLDSDGNPGTLMIVGDVKQAIYRWRGGQPEQFLDLVNLRNNPFAVTPHIYSLDTNYRSAQQIIKFNNSFFKTTSPYVGNTSYHHLFSEETQQKLNSREGGLVQMEFIDSDDDFKDEAYLRHIKDAILTAQNKGYGYGDISILTRKRKHGVLISQALIDMGIPVVSSETLLLRSSPKVNFLIQLLQTAYRPEDIESRFYLIDYLVPDDMLYHHQVSEALKDMDSWLLENWGFDMQRIRFQSVYDGLEEAVHKFSLAESSDAFITFLMDEALLIEQKGDSGIVAFLDHWEKNKDKLSITAPENIEAVRIMTIHKAKGLEFPVVIFPYANSNIYEEIDPKIWMDVNADQYQGFEELLLSKKKQMLDYGEQTSQLYAADHHKLELDAFNILYVALTRAIDALFIISVKELDAKGAPKPQLYSGLLIHYLKEIGVWSDQKQTYSFGELCNRASETSATKEQEIIPYITSTKQDTAPKMVIQSAALWEDRPSDPRARGTLIHYIMSLINSAADVEPTMSLLKESGVMPSEDIQEYRELVLQIIHHPELAAHFKEDLSVKNEQEIISANGLILRPDRIVFDNNQATIIDYKTGVRSIDHREQILSYGSALEKMDYKVTNSLLVYINDTINIEYIH